VPLIVASSDGRIPRGEVCDDFVELVDIAPTFLNAAGVEPPHELDGRDLAATAHGQLAPREEAISERQTYGRRAMLKTDEWLFEMATCEDLLGNNVEPTDRGWVRSASLEEVDAGLFSLKDDPGEIHNLARHAGHADVMSELRQRLLDRIFSQDRVMTNWWQMLREKAG
jgi:arylsulfatase A-like enzyme